MLDSFGVFFENASDVKLAELIVEQGRLSFASSAALIRLVRDPQNIVKEELPNIVSNERHGDCITKKLRTLLDNAFILKQLPKDHASRLVTHLDDILDDIRDAARYIDTYMIDKVTDEAVEFATVIGTMTGRLISLTELILKLSPEVVEGVYVELRQHEARADELRSAGVNALARRVKEAPDAMAKADALYLLVAWKDIYAKLERVTDHCLHAVGEIAIMVRNY